MSRLVYNNQTVDGQADFFQSDGYTRITGLAINQLVVTVFWNNQLMPWPFVLGLGVTDIQCAAGLIYFNEIAGSPGFYSVRFHPNATGYWRVIIQYPADLLTVISEFDVVPHREFEASLNASFIRPGS